MAVAAKTTDNRILQPADDQTRMLGLLHTILLEQSRGYKKLEASLIQKKAALANADVEGITKRCRVESTLLSRLGELERDRRTVVAKLTESMEPGRKKSFTMNELTARLDAETQSELLKIAKQLRKHVDAVRQLNEVIKMASDDLSQQMNQVMQSVQQSLSKTVTYQRQGGLAKAANISTAVDIQS